MDFKQQGDLQHSFVSYSNLRSMNRWTEEASFFDACIATDHGFVSASTSINSVELLFIWNSHCFEWTDEKEIPTLRELINLAKAFAKFIAEEA